MCRAVKSSIIFAVVVWLSCLPAASADECSSHGHCQSSQQSAITAAAICVVVLVLLILIALAVWWWRRRQRLQSRDSSATRTAADAPPNRPPKPQYSPPNQDYSVYYQTAHPAPPPPHMPQYPKHPQYPPHDFPAYNSHSVSQTPLLMPVTSPLECRDEAGTAVPTLASPSPSRAQESVEESPAPSIPSLPPRTSLVQPSSASLNPLSAALPPSAAHHQALSPMQTEASNKATDESPPAYTPI